MRRQKEDHQTDDTLTPKSQKETQRISIEKRPTHRFQRQKKFKEPSKPAKQRPLTNISSSTANRPQTASRQLSRESTHTKPFKVATTSGQTSSNTSLALSRSQISLRASTATTIKADTHSKPNTQASASSMAKKSLTKSAKTLRNSKLNTTNRDQ